MADENTDTTATSADAGANGAADAPQQQETGLSGNVLLYRQPEPLNVERHGNLGLKRSGQHLSFAKGANFLPIVATEFVSACGDYPIVFAGDQHMPVAVMGLKEGENVFIRANGSMEPHVYAPAYLRRYPFIVANHPDGRSLVCIDRAMETISDQPDIPFFENGQPSAFTRDAMALMEDYEQQRRFTEEMVAELRALDLFEPQVSQYTPTNPDRTQGQPVTVAQFIGVSQQKLVALKPEQIKSLLEKGYMAMIFAHFFSLNNWQKLITRSVERGFLPGAQPTAAA